MAQNGIAVKSFTSWDQLEIAYHEWGPECAPAAPVVLHHGFVADAHSNWLAPGVVDALLGAGRRVIAPDARGHGRSQKPHDPARYGEQRMARDLAVLIDVIGADEVDLVGYSMGAIVALIYASGGEDREAGGREHPEMRRGERPDGRTLARTGRQAGGRVRRLVVGGVGSGVIECGGVDRRAVSNESIIEALRVENPATLASPEAAAFRRLADAMGGDREALVAQASSIFRGEIQLERIAAPTLVLAGDADPLAVRPEVLAAAIPQATLRILSGNHMQAVADPRFAKSIVDFLA
jgi:pimeloyl-ACP methyl ester carboxylesterase